jgi:hypothetical protein
MTTANLKNLVSSMLTNETLLIGKRLTPKKTVEGKRNEVIEEVKQTLEALRTYDGGPFKFKMARSARNGIAVKIGYGTNNEYLLSFGFDAKGKRITEYRCNGSSHNERKALAIDFFERAIQEIEAGGLDEELLIKMESHRNRNKSGKVRPHVSAVPDKEAA